MFVCVASLTVPCAISVHAQNAPKESRVKPNEQMTLADLVVLSASRLNMRLEFDPAVLQGNVSLKMPDGMRDEELWTLTNQVLAQRGFTTIRLSGATALSVVRSSDAAGLAAVEVREPAKGNAPAERFLPGFSALAVTVKGSNPRGAMDAMKPLLTKGVGSVTQLGDSSVVVVADYTSKLQDILSVLDRIEAPKASGVLIESVQVRDSKPSALVTLVSQIAAKQQAAGGEKVAGELVASDSDGSILIISPANATEFWRGLIERFDRAEQLETRDYRPRAFGVADVSSLIQEYVASLPNKVDAKTTVVVDDLTGTLIITTTPSLHGAIETLLERLDATEAGPLPLRSFAIRNRPVNDILRTLEQLIEAGALATDLSGTNGAAQSVKSRASQTTFRDVRTGTAPLLPETTQPAVRSSDEKQSNLRFTADESTNTLIAIGEARLLRQVEDLLAMLDVRQPQVMLEVLLVSVTDTEAVNLGIELEKLGTIDGGTYKLASLFGLSSAGNGTRTVGDASGLTGAVLKPGEFSAVVRALQAVNLGRSVSTPRVLVTNNEQATFSSVLSQPFLRTDTTSNTATSSFGGSDSAGTTISVRPQIAQGDHLVLTYSINLSSFVGTPAAAGLPPPKQQTNVDSVATIPDGHIIAVGGLELASESKSTSQVPVLGDIPLVGELFKNRSKGASKNKFFAFIRASVLRSESFDDLRFRSLKDASDAGLPQDWPKVEPRVLEVDP